MSPVILDPPPVGSYYPFEIWHFQITLNDIKNPLKTEFHDNQIIFLKFEF